jgi:hypothetical protein
VSRTTGKTVVTRLEIAGSFWSRLAGLQFRRELPPNSALLLAPCSSVHTGFVRFPLDVAFLDREGVVLAVRRNLRPWRLAFGPRRSHAVVEFAAGEADVLPGDVLRLDVPDGGDSWSPQSASFLQNRPSD